MAMKTIILSVKQLSLLLAILTIHHLLQSNSASIEPDPGTVISRRDRNLRKLLSSPPLPEVDRVSHYYNFDPPPPSSPTVQIHNTASNLRVSRRRSPPAPNVAQPRHFSTPPMAFGPPPTPKYKNSRPPPPPPESS